MGNQNAANNPRISAALYHILIITDRADRVRQRKLRQNHAPTARGPALPPGPSCRQAVVASCGRMHMSRAVRQRPVIVMCRLSGDILQMRTVRQALVMPLIALAGVTCFIAGWLIGQCELADKGNGLAPLSRQDVNRSLEHFPEVQDALARYRAQLGSEFERTMDSREIQIMQLRDRVCVQFQLQWGNVGGTPVWCYAGRGLRQRELQLVYDGSVVE